MRMYINTGIIISTVFSVGYGIALLMTAFLVKQRNAAIAKLIGPSATREILGGIAWTMFGLTNLELLVEPDTLGDAYSTFVIGISILRFVALVLLAVTAGTDWYTRKPPPEYRLARTIT